MHSVLAMHFSKVPNVQRFGNAVVKKCRMYCVLAMQLSKNAKCMAFWQCSCQQVPNVLRFGHAVVKKCRMYSVLAMLLQTVQQKTNENQKKTKKPLKITKKTKKTNVWTH